MSPFLVYLLMMADDIKSTASVLAVMLCLAALLALAFYIAMTCWHNENARKAACYPAVRDYAADVANSEATLQLSRRLLRAIIYPLVLLGLVGTFMPGTKTIAAMIVLPKLTSRAALDALGNEGRELYNLAKDALKGLTPAPAPARK